MNQMPIFLNILISLLAINFIHGQNLETALLFNTKNNAILRMTNSNKSDVCANCATACPFWSTSRSQTKFNKKYSISKKAFFLQEIHPNSIMENINLEICQKPFELSIIYDRIEKVVEFGYEIYYEDSQNNRELKESVYRKYGPIKELPLEILVRTLSRIHQSFNKNLSFPNDKPNLPLQGKKMRFLWISAFKLNYNGVLRHPNRVTYETSVNIPDSPNKCSNYKIGEEIYKGIIMKNMYKQGHLDDICKGKVVPKIDETNGYNNFIEEMVYENGQVCIKMWNLIPDKYFLYYSPKLRSCSYLTTVPVWCYQADKLLQKLDLIIDAITEILPEKKLHIISGTYETLRLNLKDNQSSKKPSILKAQTRLVEIYLSDNKLPIPAKIYKVIEYKLPNCSENQTNCWYSILIEIHNAPYFTAEERICVGNDDDDNKCAEWGWDSVYEKDTVQARYISCCEVTTEIEAKLKLKTDETKFRSIFDLWAYKIEYEEGIEKNVKSLKEIVDDVIRKKPKVEIDNTSNKKVAETEEESEAISFDQRDQEAATSSDTQPLLLM